MRLELRDKVLERKGVNWCHNVKIELCCMLYGIDFYGAGVDFRSEHWQIEISVGR